MTTSSATPAPPPAAAGTHLRLGVLAVQGDVVENVLALRKAAAGLRVDAKVVAVKTPHEIANVDGLVIPGGESTTIGRMSLANGSLDRVRQMAASGTKPVLGICAGMVLLAGHTSDKVTGDTKQPLLGALDVRLERNSFGRQRQSFEADISLDPIGIPAYRGVFIRAPAIIMPSNGNSGSGDDDDDGTTVRPIAWLDDKVVAVKKGNIMATSFHPELTKDPAVHRYFVGLARDSKQRAAG